MIWGDIYSKFNFIIISTVPWLISNCESTAAAALVSLIGNTTPRTHISNNGFNTFLTRRRNWMQDLVSHVEILFLWITPISTCSTAAHGSHPHVVHTSQYPCVLARYTAKCRFIPISLSPCAVWCRNVAATDRYKQSRQNKTSNYNITIDTRTQYAPLIYEPKIILYWKTI